MILGFSTLGCPDWSFETVLEKASEYGFGALEIRGIQGEMKAWEIPAFQTSHREETKKLLREKGLIISDYGSSIRLHETEKWEEHLLEAEKTSEVCNALGIPAIRVFGNNIVGEETECVRMVGEHARQVCEIAAGYGVKILLETHGDFNTAERILKVRDLCGCDNFGVIWDICHTERAYGDDWRTFYEAVKPLICHLHYKDSIRPDHKLCLVGEGSIPIPEITRTLLQDGYSGVCSLEWEKKWHPDLPDPEEAFPAFVEYMNRFL